MKPLMKGKLTPNINLKPTNPMLIKPHVDYSADESLSLSSIYQSDTQANELNGSEEEDGENDDDYDVTQMTNQEARWLYNDEVSFSSCICHGLAKSERSSPSYPRPQMIQIDCLTMTTTLRLALKNLVAARSGPAQKLHNHRL
jgi:hypothetical protein